MTVLKNEINLINNPALGAYLQWKYALAYQNKHAEHEPSPGILLFLVLPILFHRPTLEFLDGTYATTGLAKFSEKFLNTTYKKSDLLLSLHARALEMRLTSLHSLQMAARKNLIAVVPQSGRVISFDQNKVKEPRGVPAIANKMRKNSEKIGYWFSQNSLKDISFYLKVFF